jgi:hypothetical protein
MAYRELILGAGSRPGKDLRLPTAVEMTALDAARQGKGLASWPVGSGNRYGKEFVNPVTLDINPDHKPDIQFNLERIDGGTYNQIPLPSRLPEPGGITKTPDNYYSEIHAYEVLEHIGRQGDYHKFFAQFSEFWRILVPDGFLFATVPHWSSMWAWGDPSHSRVINAGSLVFLSQKQYTAQVGVTAMSDFRYIYKADFETVFIDERDECTLFVLRAVK